MGRSPSFNNLRMKPEGLGNDDECTKRFGYMPKQGSDNWSSMSKKEEVVGKYGKSCRIKRKTSDCLNQIFTPQEEDLIVKLHATIGSRWFIIAQQFPGITDNEVKTIWNTKLRKKLTAMGIDPVTHRPFSQILADYGNIGASLNADKSRFGSLCRNMKTNPNFIPSETDSYTRNTMLSNTDDNSLLSQLEAIKLVTKTDSSYSVGLSYQFSSKLPTEAAFGSPSSSSSQGGASSGFDWFDFLVEDESPSGAMQEQVNNGNTSRDMVMEDVGNVQMNSFEAMPSSRSFVEAILDNEHDMFSDFQGFAEDQFHY